MAKKNNSFFYLSIFVLILMIGTLAATGMYFKSQDAQLSPLLQVAGGQVGISTPPIQTECEKNCQIVVYACKAAADKRTQEKFNDNQRQQATCEKPDKDVLDSEIQACADKYTQGNLNLCSGNAICYQCTREAYGRFNTKTQHCKDEYMQRLIAYMTVYKQDINKCLDDYVNCLLNKCFNNQQQS